MPSNAVSAEARSGTRDEPLDTQVVSRALTGILTSTAFAKAERSSRFLRYLIDRRLADDLDALKESVIALEVFDKSSSFDAKKDSTVRTGASRLRNLLGIYYREEGKRDAVQISLPVGTYIPIFDWDRARLWSPASVERPSRPRLEALVGRRDQIIGLKEHAAGAFNGQARLVCVVAEPGVGKTALLEAFLTEFSKAPVGRGQCRLQFQQSQPYQVWLDSLADLTRSSTSVTELLRTSAPHWFGLIEGLPATTGASANVLRREMEQFFQRLTREEPAILIFDDLHWADSATIELLGHLMPAVAAFPLLILAAYRPSDMQLRQGSFLTLQRELSIHQLCHVIPLPLLTRAEVADYLNIRFPNHQIRASILDSLYEASSGNALCITDMVDHAVKQKWISHDGGLCKFTTTPNAWRVNLPMSVSEMAAKKLQELDEEFHALLWRCSLQGVVFDSAIVARTMQVERQGLERQLRRLTEVHHILKPLSGPTPPIEGTRYEFSHFLYFDALERQDRAAEKRTLSAKMVKAMVDVYGETDDNAAPVMARLFEQAGATSSARQFYVRIAIRAAAFSAFREVFNVTEHALSLRLERAPTEQDLRWHMILLTLQGRAGMALHGFEFGAIESICQKAEAIASKLGDSQASMSINLLQWGLIASSGFSRGLTLAQAVLKRARKLSDAEFVANGGLATGVTFIHMGRFKLAEETLSRANEAWSVTSDLHEMPGVGVSTGISILCNWARALWFYGFPDRALTTVVRASDMARKTSHKKNWAYSAAFVADIHHLRRDVSETLRWADEAIEIAQENEFAHELTWATILKASALTECGDPHRAVQLCDAVLRKYHGPCRAKFSCHFAWAVGIAGDPAKGLRIVAEAYQSAQDRHETYYDAELIRVRGELLALQENLDSSARQAITRIFNQAASTARSQHASTFHLRARASLLRFDLRNIPGATRHDAAALRRAIESFREGGDTVDLRGARELLSQADSIR